MAWWSRKPKAPKFAYPNASRDQSRSFAPAADLDRLVADAHHHGRVRQERATWQALAAQYPESLAEGEEPLAVSVAKAFGTSRAWGTLLFATDRQLISAGNLQRLFSIDFAVIQSIGVIMNPLSETDHPELQVLVVKEADPADFTLGLARYELLPTEEMAIFWKSLREAITAMRPDLQPHYAGLYGGLGVPPPAGEDDPWYSAPPLRRRT